MVLIVAIIGMIIIMVRERNRVLVIETEAQTIHRVQHNGNIVQHHITILSTYGETALSWEGGFCELSFSSSAYRFHVAGHAQGV